MRPSLTPVDISDVEIDVAFQNIEDLISTLEKVMRQFESSPNYEVLIALRKWDNHPDQFSVDDSVFSTLLNDYFGDITMHYFLTEFTFKHEPLLLSNMLQECREQYDKLSHDDVECALEQMYSLHNRLHVKNALTVS